MCVSVHVQEFAPVCVLSTLQSTLTLWSLRGLSLPMYVVFKRCLPLFTLSIGVCVLRNGAPSAGVVVAVLITTGGAALAGKHSTRSHSRALSGRNQPIRVGGAVRPRPQEELTDVMMSLVGKFYLCFSV